MAALKRLARIKKIYELRAQNAERLAAERAAARGRLEDARDAMGRTLQEEVDNCDSIERVPFDFAARYYRASLEGIAAQEKDIEAACDLEVDARAELQQRYVEKKEFEVYYNRKLGARKAEIRARRDGEARDLMPKSGEGDDLGLSDKLADIE